MPDWEAVALVCAIKRKLELVTAGLKSKSIVAPLASRSAFCGPKLPLIESMSNGERLSGCDTSTVNAVA